MSYTTTSSFQVICGSSFLRTIIRGPNPTATPSLLVSDREPPIHIHAYKERTDGASSCTPLHQNQIPNAALHGLEAEQ
jgi:hypothetical protein